MRKLGIVVAIVAVSAVAALVRAPEASAAPSFTCGPVSAGAFTCYLGGQEFSCLAGSPAPGSFTCTSTKGRRSFTCTRSGVNTVTCYFGKNPNAYECVLDPLTSEWSCTKL